MTISNDHRALTTKVPNSMSFAYFSPVSENPLELKTHHEQNFLYCHPFSWVFPVPSCTYRNTPVPWGHCFLMWWLLFLLPQPWCHWVWRSGKCYLCSSLTSRISCHQIMSSTSIPFSSHLWPLGYASLFKILAPKWISLSNTSPVLIIGDFNIHVDVRDPSQYPDLLVPLLQ